jgi:hypothetical protein
LQSRGTVDLRTKEGNNNNNNSSTDPWRLLTTVGALLIIGDNVVMALRFEPVADAKCSLDASDKVGVLVGVLAGLVEHTHDLLAAWRCLRNRGRNK